MLSTVTSLITESVRRLHLSDEVIKKLITPNVVHDFTITLNNGKQFQAYRSQHSNARGPYKGGIRFHPDVSKDEVIALSILMSLKTALIGIPLGGGKGGIVVDPKTLTKAELEELSRKYVQHLVDFIGPDKDIPAPDVQTNSQIIDWMVDEYEHLTGDTSKASFTGKSLSYGGSNGREEATGRGGLVVTKAIIESKNISNPTYGIQGFGNVGTFFATAAQELCPNWTCIAASDSRSAISAKILLPQKLVNYKKANGTLFSYDKSTVISSEELLAYPCDILVLAAMGGVITEKNVNSIQSKFVVELANGPVTDIAAEYLSKKEIEVVPDILANSGGVIVSYFEWVQNKNAVKWKHQTVINKLDTTILAATNDVLQYAQSSHTTLKQAAIDVAVQKLFKN